MGDQVGISSEVILKAISDPELRAAAQDHCGQCDHLNNHLSFTRI